jgi:LacI family repressor for deo operon, udp, cdd, tsx, nupC, and nupG
VDRAFENFNGYYVSVDNRAGAYAGTRHLIACGYTRIGILAGLERLSTMRERLDGYCQALQDAGLPLTPEWIIPSQLSVESGSAAMRTLLSLPQRPDAVFINNNLLALGALLELKAQDVSSPHDLGMVAFDDHPWAAVSCPSMTVVRQPTRQIGQAAAEMILSLIDNRPVPEKRVLLTCELVVRQSCRPQK